MWYRYTANKNEISHFADASPTVDHFNARLILYRIIKKVKPTLDYCRVPELIPVLGSQPAGDVSHKPGCRLPLLSARPAVTSETLKRAATNFAAW